MKKLRNARPGFTLIEILMCIFVMGIIFVMFQAALTSSLLNRRVKNQDLALRIAAGELEEMRAAGYDNLPSGGAISNALLGSLPSGFGSIAISNYNDKTKLITASVLWQEKNRGAPTSTLTLSTLIGEGGL